MAKPDKKPSSGLMKLVKVLFLLFMLSIFFLLGATVLLPSSYGVSRQIVIDADRDDIHALVGDLERWPEWDPWKEEDASIKVTLGEKTSGVGAKQTWSSDQGAGSITFTGSDEEKGITYDMTFESMTSSGVVGYADAGDGKTQVTWRFSGEVGLNPIMRFFAWQMEDMVGPVLEKGLKKLKSKAEAE